MSNGTGRKSASSGTVERGDGGATRATRAGRGALGAVGDVVQPQQAAERVTDDVEFSIGQAIERGAEDARARPAARVGSHRVGRDIEPRGRRPATARPARSASVRVRCRRSPCRITVGAVRVARLGTSGSVDHASADDLDGWASHQSHQHQRSAGAPRPESRWTRKVSTAEDHHSGTDREIAAVSTGG